MLFSSSGISYVTILTHRIYCLFIEIGYFKDVVMSFLAASPMARWRRDVLAMTNEYLTFV